MPKTTIRRHRFGGWVVTTETGATVRVCSWATALDVANRLATAQLVSEPTA